MVELNPDTLKVLRILVKVSSLIENIDHIELTKFYKFDFKRKTKSFISVVESVIDPVLIQLMGTDDTTYPQLMKGISDYSASLLVGDEDEANLVLLYAKLMSSLNDISELTEKTRTESHLIISILPRIKSLVTSIEKQFPFLIEATDMNNVKLKSVIETIDELSKDVIRH